MIRRRFVFWLGMGLFGLAEKLRADSLDEWAASLMRGTEPEKAITPPATPEHWTVEGNRTWRWYQRENLIDGKWTPTGITTPIHKRTGQPFTGKTGYLDDRLVPPGMRLDIRAVKADVDTDASEEHDHGQPNPTRRARHGRPPSRWLRSLYADEIRIWLKTIDVPEAGVSGMTFWTHLTQDHSFDAEKIAGLTVDEQAKLHAAAHFGY